MWLSNGKAFRDVVKLLTGIAVIAILIGAMMGGK